MWGIAHMYRGAMCSMDGAILWAACWEALCPTVADATLPQDLQHQAHFQDLSRRALGSPRGVIYLVYAG